jgi:hypothetical protein
MVLEICADSPRSVRSMHGLSPPSAYFYIASAQVENKRGIGEEL